MKRKLLALVLAGLFLITAAACGTVDDPIPGESTAVLKLVRVDWMLAVQQDGNYARLCTLGLSDGVKITDESGKKLSKADLHAGMMVEIQWPGMVQLSWPEQINRITSVRVVEQDDDFVGLYRTVLRTLWELEPELNENITYVGWDFTSLTNLSEAELAALEYLLRIDLEFGMDINTVEGAYIDRTADYLENGLLMTVELVEETDGRIVFNAVKWRGTEHAVVLTNCVATRGENGAWSWSKSE